MNPQTDILLRSCPGLLQFALQFLIGKMLLALFCKPFCLLQICRQFHNIVSTSVILCVQGSMQW